MAKKLSNKEEKEIGGIVTALNTGLVSGKDILPLSTEGLMKRFGLSHDGATELYSRLHGNEVTPNEEEATEEEKVDKILEETKKDKKEKKEKKPATVLDAKKLFEEYTSNQKNGMKATEKEQRKLRRLMRKAGLYISKKSEEATTEAAAA